MIYRDLEERPVGMQTADFVGSEEVDSIRSFMSSVRAIANTDTCEDVTGGLEVCTPDCIIWHDTSCCYYKKACNPCKDTYLSALCLA